jgi:hypothetical protein
MPFSLNCTAVCDAMQFSGQLLRKKKMSYIPRTKVSQNYKIPHYTLS